MPKGKLLTREEGARVGWGDVTENADIVSTMMKLSPEDLLHLLVYRHRYATKGSVVQFVRLQHPRYVPRRSSIQTPSRFVFGCDSC